MKIIVRRITRIEERKQRDLNFPEKKVPPKKITHYDPRCWFEIELPDELVDTIKLFDTVMSKYMMRR